jgi:hypothetical protein
MDSGHWELQGRAAAAVATLVALSIAGQALALPPSNIGITTVLLSKSTSGGLPNGPSGHPVVSRDQRFSSVLAFDSAATNLVSQSVGGGSNVYFINRSQPFDNTGGPWSAGSIQLASQGLGGQPANGPSSLPAVGGDNQHSPACIAFISAASNLVNDDTNGKADAFAYFLSSHAVVRLSVDSRGRQANGSASQVVANGRCTQFAFTDDATNLAGRVPSGTSEVYLRDLHAKKKITVTVKRHGHKHRKRKTVFGPVTSLVSANSGHAANAPALEPSFAEASGDLAFASSATNLLPGTGGHSQVYGLGPRLGKLHLLSVTPGGAPGDGDSDQPALAQGAKGYAFRTRASNLGGAAGIARVIVSTNGGPISVAGAPSNADMNDPIVGVAGDQVAFASAGSNLVGAQDNAQPPAGIIGCWLYSAAVGGDILESRNSDEHPLSFDCLNPFASESGNYVFFETPDPFADKPFASSQGFDADPGGTAQRARTDPTFHQVYLRYFGGR